MPVEAARVHLEHGQIAHTETTLNYRITKIYEGDKLVKSLVYDVHSNKKIENPDIISRENVVEERYEDLENLAVMKYDYEGKLISQKAFKKDGRIIGEILLSQNEVRAIEKYDVEDEELTIQSIDWDKVIYADENFSKEFVVRWSDSRDYKVKTLYTRDGLIHKRIVFNKHTGQKQKLDHKIYAQVLSKDLVQNNRGFIEIYYNKLGKVTAIRSWDRKSGRIIDPPRLVPFSFRLERDHLKMDFEQHKNFRADYFRDYAKGKPINFEEGKSLFDQKKETYQLIKNVSVAPFISSKTNGKTGQNKSGVFRDLDSEAVRIQALFRPGKYEVQTDFISTDFSSRVQGSFLIKNTLFDTGSDLAARLSHLDSYVRKSLFSRQDASVNLLGGLRANFHDLNFVDGSRTSSYSDITLQPILGYELNYFPWGTGRLMFKFLATKFHIGGVNTSGVRSGIEYRQKIPISLSKIFDSLELGVGYRRNDYQMRTDTDTVSEVGFDSFFRGTFLELATRF
ncbi:MAG: hypothetical protein VX619_01225 [bacterium]|nr:hypothetical protein [bacterium]